MFEGHPECTSGSHFNASCIDWWSHLTYAAVTGDTYVDFGCVAPTYVRMCVCPRLWGNNSCFCSEVQNRRYVCTYVWAGTGMKSALSDSFLKTEPSWHHCQLHAYTVHIINL